MNWHKNLHAQVKVGNFLSDHLRIGRGIRHRLRTHGTGLETTKLTPFARTVRVTPQAYHNIYADAVLHRLRVRAQNTCHFEAL